jgi:hypothetical protein
VTSCYCKPNGILNYKLHPGPYAVLRPCSTRIGPDPLDSGNRIFTTHFSSPPTISHFSSSFLLFWLLFIRHFSFFVSPSVSTCPFRCQPLRNCCSSYFQSSANRKQSDKMCSPSGPKRQTFGRNRRRRSKASAATGSFNSFAPATVVWSRASNNSPVDKLPVYSIAFV